MLKLDRQLEKLQDYLQVWGWLIPGERLLSTEIPGAGNMNFTLRLLTDKRSFILKQSREYVEKYPQVSAPKERVIRESEFYGLIASRPELSTSMPKVLALDPENSVIMLEDLGNGSDYTFLYQPGQEIARGELMGLMDFLAQLHQHYHAATASIVIKNPAMRALNHEHIFVYPFMSDNGLELDGILPGLDQATSWRQDRLLRERARDLGQIYLADGESLLHGDFFPGSWLKTQDGVKIIDPEFCFFGPPEFDLGICVAHLMLSEQPPELIEQAISRYTSSNKLDGELREKFTAIEILRRILGLAQLPLSIGLTQRILLVEQAMSKLIS